MVEVVGSLKSVVISKLSPHSTALLACDSVCFTTAVNW